MFVYQHRSLLVRQFYGSNITFYQSFQADNNLFLKLFWQRLSAMMHSHFQLTPPKTWMKSQSIFFSILESQKVTKLSCVNNDKMIQNDLSYP